MGERRIYVYMKKGFSRPPSVHTPPTAWRVVVAGGCRGGNCTAESLLLLDLRIKKRSIIICRPHYQHTVRGRRVIGGVEYKDRRPTVVEEGG